LDLSPSGLVSGAPATAGTYSVIITVLDSESPAAQVSVQYPIDIAGAATFAITSGPPPGGTVGIDYGPSTTQYFSCVWSPVLGWHLVCTECPSLSACAALPACTGGLSAKPCLSTQHVFLGFTLTAIGGVPPYTWMVTGLPPDLAVDPGSGQITGTPTTVGSYSVAVTVTDAEIPAEQVSATYVVEIANASRR